MWSWSCYFSDLFLIKLELGAGTNIKAEVLALWLALFYGKKLNLNQVQVVGDAKSVVDQFNKKRKLQVDNLDARQQRIRDMQLTFDELKLMHTSREFNITANRLSKDALLLEEGCLQIMHHIHGRCIHEETFYIF